MTGSRPGRDAPRLDEIASIELLVPIRSSTGRSPDPSGMGVGDFRHGTDESDRRFIAAFTDLATLRAHGPPGSDHVRLPARELFARAAAAGERVVVDAGAPSEVQVPLGMLRHLAAGLDPNAPSAMRARRPLGEMPSLEAPDRLPEPLGRRLRAALEELAQVERAWLLRSSTTWAAGVQMVPRAGLADFDEVRNRLHAVARECLGVHGMLRVTDLRARAVREAFSAVAGPWYVRQVRRRSILGRLTGG